MSLCREGDAAPQDRLLKHDCLSEKDFISENLPAGHDTLWGWAAKWTPQELPAGDLAKAFAIETSELIEQSAACGYSVIDVDAPAALRAYGATKIPAFDKQLLFMMSRS